jgi:hypothetical protein
VSLKIHASSHFVAESYIESADAILGRFTDPMQATKRSSSIISWKLKRLGFNNFPSRQQPSSGGKQQFQICCDGKSYSAMSIGVQDEKNTDC